MEGGHSTHLALASPYPQQLIRILVWVDLVEMKYCKLNTQDKVFCSPTNVHKVGTADMRHQHNEPQKQRGLQERAVWRHPWRPAANGWQLAQGHSLKLCIPHNLTPRSPWAAGQCSVQLLPFTACLVPLIITNRRQSRGSQFPSLCSISLGLRNMHAICSVSRVASTCPNPALIGSEWGS